MGITIDIMGANKGKKYNLFFPLSPVYLRLASHQDLGKPHLHHRRHPRGKREFLCGAPYVDEHVHPLL